MFIVTSNILAAPLALVVFAIDAYLILLAFRGLAAFTTAGRRPCLHADVERCIDGPYVFARNQLARVRLRPLHPWISWAVVIVSMILVRQLCVAAVLALAS